MTVNCAQNITISYWFEGDFRNAEGVTLVWGKVHSARFANGRSQTINLSDLRVSVLTPPSFTPPSELFFVESRQVIEDPPKGLGGPGGCWRARGEGGREQRARKQRRFLAESGLNDERLTIRPQKSGVPSFFRSGISAPRKLEVCSTSLSTVHIWIIKIFPSCVPPSVTNL